MIKYNLKCKNEHEFESWFSDSNEFDKLNNKNLLECIYCSSKKIKKSIMAPMISSSKDNYDQIRISNEELKNEKNNLLELRSFIEKNYDYVEKDFSKKVREIFYDKQSKRAIYGTATPEEKEELSEEGIELISIPWVNKNN
ncbi:DUF1178 family protein [Candidatus Pelagibacter bacterium]|jgi:hypothetical protein|nr:DUF1178 family protein [Candidatus Pelagibacter bacterium]